LAPSRAEALSKGAQAERAYVELSAHGAPPTSAQLAAAASLSSSYVRALVAELQVRPPGAGQPNGQLVSSRASVAIDSEQKR
jgi:hypothetical protein